MKYASGVISGLLIAFVIAYAGINFGGDYSLSGTHVSEDRSVEYFNKIVLMDSGILNIAQGDSESLRVTADQNIMKHISSEIVNNELRLKVDSQRLFGFIAFPTSEIVYDISLKDIEKVVINGSGELKSDSLKGEMLTLKINGSGNMKANIEYDQLKAIINGSGAYSLSGNAKTQDLTISGSGKFFGKNLLGEDGKIVINGSGKSEMNTSSSLDIKVSGSGSILYLGSPAITQSISGSSKIEQIVE